MKGVIVLKAIEIIEAQDWVMYALFFSLAIAIASIIIMELIHNRYIIIPVCTGMLSIVCVIVFFVMIGIKRPIKHTNEYEYVVRVDNSVNFNEFYEKYEILNKKEYTNVYTVKERLIE